MARAFTTNLPFFLEPLLAPLLESGVPVNARAVSRIVALSASSSKPRLIAHATRNCDFFANSEDYVQVGQGGVA